MIELNEAADAIRNVVVRETGRGQFQQEVIWGLHRLIADEPTGVGGPDSGLGPYELLLASLGACTANDPAIIWRQKAPAIEERARLAASHSRIHAKDCAECETKSGMLDHIERICLRRLGLFAY